ncbi:NAD-dependent epimerase/dehydratase family protein [Neobacillus sp. OS1-33]|uniref:NAD-dependent epimerase/dehydratase family protein n=1 Tax=Neobacillus sp. OS1-33 TaxID=3070683 RepID=UPI0027DF4C78|nr:NAD-dependent epimerase/dehydratase family protein [Neobacillus sp. OS1-33]WML27929.1 GDP-mannose 4,6-dehydratase [Neobacillus sp. OS1-33]
MKVIVTGGAGFIGSHLTRRLLKGGHEVLIIDELHPYYSVARKKRQLEFVREAGEFAFFQKSLLHDEAEVKEIFLSYKPEMVIHLAAIPGVSHSISAPNEYVDYDIKATVNALRFAGQSNVKHFIFASSSSVYGEQKNAPLQEEMAMGKVVSPYAAAKFGAESFCHAYSSLFDYKISILRFFTVYGPWGRPDMAITGFIKNLLHKKDITLFGNRTARDYTYIDDCIAGIISAFNQPERVGTYNIGSGKPIFIEELVEYLKEHFPDVTVKQGGIRQGDVNSTWADISKAHQQLGFSPSISFSEGLAKTIEWAKNHVSEIS